MSTVTRTAAFWTPGAQDRRVLGEVQIRADGQPVIALRGDTRVLTAIQSTLSSGDRAVHGQAFLDATNPREIEFIGEFTMFGPIPYTYHLPPDDVAEAELEPELVLFGGHFESPPPAEEYHIQVDVFSGLVGHRLPLPESWYWLWVGQHIECRPAGMVSDRLLERRRDHIDGSLE